MAPQIASAPASVLALPFLFARQSGVDPEWSVRTALTAAIAAERAFDSGRRNTRTRLAWLLCELGFQLDRRGIDRNGSLPIPRGELGGALGTSLCRIKRTLALLSLSQVILAEGQTIRIIDWHRLARLGVYDPARLGLAAEEHQAAAEEDREPQQLTLSGDQACFV